MKAAVLKSIGRGFEIEDVDIDEPRGREVLVEVKASGLCHTDLHMAENDFGVPLPAVFGHELAGIVRRLGPDVREFDVGDHVVGSLVQYCGHCLPCTRGRTYHCAHPEETLRQSDAPHRLTLNGNPVTPMFGTAAFAQYALVHVHQLARIPKSLPFPQASLLGCGCITGAGAAINTGAVQVGDTVAIIGVGGVGLNTVSGARLAGAQRIIAIDLSPEKEALARKFGATDFVNPADCDPVTMVRTLTDGGVDHAFEVVGLESTSEQAIAMVRKGGTVYMIGVHKPGARIKIDVVAELLTNQVVIKGVFMGSTNIKRDIPMYAELYLQGRLNLDELVSREISLGEINEAYAELKGGAIARSVITSF